MTEPKIVQLEPKFLVGIHITMSLANNLTGQLWRSFMPNRHLVKNRLSTDVISMQVYPEISQAMFSPSTEFEKWATVEVTDLSQIPGGMEGYSLQGGAYAVFHHVGPASNAPKIMGFIFSEWLPQSEYLLDHREHFEVLPEGYNPIDAEAEEDIWIPVKKKG